MQANTRPLHRVMDRPPSGAGSFPVATALPRAASSQQAQESLGGTLCSLNHAQTDALPPMGSGSHTSIHVGSAGLKASLNASACLQYDARTENVSG